MMLSYPNLSLVALFWIRVPLEHTGYKSGQI